MTDTIGPGPTVCGRRIGWWWVDGHGVHRWTLIAGWARWRARRTK